MENKNKMGKHKIKNEKKTLDNLRSENKALIRVYEKSMTAFKKTETEKTAPAKKPVRKPSAPPPQPQRKAKKR